MENIEEEIKILDYLQGRSTVMERKVIEEQFQLSPAFAAKFNEVKRAWESLDLRSVPEMNPEIGNNFQAMLKTFELEQEHTQSSFWSRLAGLFKYRRQYNWAYAMLLVCFGITIGYLLIKPRAGSDNNSGVVRNDPQQNKVLAMLEDPTAAGRMKAVNYAKDLHQVNDQVIKALLLTLNTDDNENVRLVTLDALLKLADDPKVREGLISSISIQQSELMKAALADAMLQLQEKRSTGAFKKILKDQHHENPVIKKKLEQTVKELESI